MTQAATAGDGIKWHAHARVEKYSPAQVDYARSILGREAIGAELRALCGDPADGVVEADGNLLVTVGLNLLTGLITGASANTFSHSNAIVGVGAGTATATIADTALTDDNTANAWYQQADASNPSQSNGVITCVCTFLSGNANFAWQEWCFAVGTGGITAGTHLSAVATSPVMVNHKVQSLGTKASGAAWVLTATLTIS